MPIKPHSYDLLIRSLKDKGEDKIQITGFDTLVLFKEFDDVFFQEMKDTYQKFTTNSDYFGLTDLIDYPTTSLFAKVDYHRFGCAVNIFLDNEEYFLPVCQVFFNTTGIKYSIYGALFRLSKLFGYDRLKIASIAYHEITGRHLQTLDIIRADYAIDCHGYDTTEKFVLENSTLLPQKGGWQYRDIKTGVLETQYYGPKGSKYSYLRLYNKTLDGKCKKKNNLYKDYLDTMRLEWQFGSLFIPEGTTIFDLKFLEEKIKSYIGIGSEFDGLYYIGKRYDPDYIHNFERYCKRIFKRVQHDINNGFKGSPEKVLSVINDYLISIDADFIVRKRKRKIEHQKLKDAMRYK